MTTRGLLVLAALNLALAANDAAGQPKSCKLIRIEEWKVLPDSLTPVLDGAINGHKIGVLLDTGFIGEEGALLERNAALRLGVPLEPYPDRRFAGLGGESQPAIGLIDEIRIGQAIRRKWRVMVGGEDHGHRGRFLIGNTFFKNHELEFDLAHDAVRYFKSQNCEGVSLAYWTKEPAGEVPLWTARHIELDVRINGKRVRAVLDSGSSTTLLDMQLAARLGVTKDTPGTRAGRCVRGFGKHPVDSWIGQFDTLTIGNEVIRNPKMYFADLSKGIPHIKIGLYNKREYELPEMILGADFLRAHRVLIARGYGKLFFTYAGGTVFFTEWSEPCSRAN